MLRFVFLLTIISSFLYPADQFKKLTLEERANYKFKIEEVYQKHRSNGNDFKLPDFEFFLKEAEKDIKYTNALELFFNYKIDEEKLQGEIERIVENTRQPQVLKEIFAALENDPEIIAEVYARDILSERILENLYYNDDKFQKDLRDLVQSEIKKVKYAIDLKNLSGKYIETTVKVKNKNGLPEKNTMEFNKNEFENFLNFLSKKFNKIDERKFADGTFLEIGKISKIVEDRESIRVTGILDKGRDYIKICTAYWEKKRFQKWWEEIEDKIPTYLKLNKGNFKIPQIRNNSCRDDTWYKLPGPPDERYNSASLVFGNYFTIWGGLSDDLIPLNTGLRYNITSDSWSEISTTNAPTARKDFMYCTTLQHMYIWGGRDADGNYLNTGAHYNSYNDTWQTIVPVGNVPSGRRGGVLVYSGYVSGLILFGGENASGKLNDLYYYSFITSRWIFNYTLNPPSPRSNATGIVYTSGDDYLLVWGGKDSSNNPLGDGKKFSVASNSWQTIASAPPGNARYDYSILLSGDKALIWGGIGSGNNPLNTGLIYNFTANNWTPMSSSGLSGRYGHSAVLVDSNNMIIWGGTNLQSAYFNDGKKYSISGNSWIDIPEGPSGRAFHAAGFSGGHMFIWGGKNNFDVLGSGAKYNVSGNTWTSLYDGGAPTARYDYGITWTGTEVVIFSGCFPGFYYEDGKKYNLSNDTWSSIADSTEVIEGRALPAFYYWPSGQSIIVWGGSKDFGVTQLGDGAIYNISSNSWTYIDPNDDPDTPSPRSYFASAWDPTSEKMYVWGGYTNDEPYYANDGAIYDPANSTDPWQPIPIDDNTPSERAMVLGVWTGSKFIVWGGEDINWETLNTGGIYDPISQSWTPTSITNAPNPRAFHLAKYIDTGMAIWGGDDYLQVLNDGGILNSSNQWSSFPSENAPEARTTHSGNWNGRDLFIWGGSNYDNHFFNNGARYDLSSFTPVSTTGAPKGKANFEIIWTDGYFFVWGGIVKNGYTNMGALYCSCLNAPPQATNPSPSNGGKACVSQPVDFSCENGEANLFDIYIDSTLECENVSSCSCSKSLAIGSHTWSVVSENHCGTASGSPPVWTLDVITTPGSASNPEPANGSFKCSSSPITATWSAGTYAEKYDVYLNSNLISSCENISETTCNFGLLSGGNYNWYVISENICGSEQGPTWNFSVDTGVPNSATDPDPANGSSVCPDPDLSWTAASGTRTYDVYFNTQKICSDITNTSCDPGTISSGSHSWYVVAKNGCGNTQSPNWSFSIKTAPGSASNPSPYNGEELCTLTPTLSWDAAPNATSYDVYVDNELKCEDITSTTCNPGALSAGDHTWYVISKNGCPTQNNIGPTWIFSLDEGAPGNVTNIYPPNGSYPCPNPTLDWDASPNTRRYDVYLDSEKICSNISYTYCDTTVSSGSHSWHVVSKNRCGSTQTGPFNFTILQIPSQPNVQDKDTCQLNGVNISWSNVDGATGYDLRVDGSTIITDVNSPYTYEPRNSSSHNYQIRAKNGLCTTSWSPQTSGTDENNTPTPTISGASQNTCPNEFVLLSTQNGMSNYQWYRNGEIIAGANNYQYTATLSGNYTVYYQNSYGCGNTSSPHSVTIVQCYGPPPVADGKLYGNGAKFKKASDFGTTGNIDVTFDNVACSNHHISILYGNLIGANNFDGYDGCALADGGSSGSTSFNSSSQNNVWYNIIWVTDYFRAGHAGFNYQGGSNGERNWSAVGHCSITSELQNDNTCD